MLPLWLIAILIAATLLLILFVASYVKAKPDEAFIITGPRKSRIIIGKGTIRIPFLERVDIIPLSLIQTDIKTNSAVPTNEFINIFVDGVANIRIKTDDESIKLAGQIFLSRDLEGIRNVTREVLEGNMREIIGQMKLKELVQNRDKFAEQVRNSATQDMEKMGLEIINITIQNFSDKNGVIEDLGVDNVTQIRKDASIARANSEKEVQIAAAQAKKLANDARVTAELEIEQQNNQLALRQADLKQKADTAKASADAAYEIQKAGETKRVNIAQQDAEIAKREKEVELREREVRVEEKTLEAKVKKTAEAQRYAAQQKADADLYVRTKEAEAKLAEQGKAAEAFKLTAEAQRFSEEQRAAGIAAVGIAEAEAIQKKAEAMKLMEQAAVLELVLESKVLPEMIAAAAKPMEKVGNIVMLGENQSSKLAGDVMKTTTNIIEGLKGSGIDVMSLLTGALGGTLLGSKKEDPNKDQK
jgi:flotillin